jgi:hypothetical protein
MHYIQVGKIYRVKNQEKKGAANDHYDMIVVEDSAGSLEELLFTDSDILKANIRAKKNKEDIPSYRVINHDSGWAYWLGLITVATFSGVLGYFIKDLHLF